MPPRAVTNVQDPTLCQAVPNDKSFLAPRMEALSPDPHRKHRVRSANTKLPLINRPHAMGAVVLGSHQSNLSTQAPRARLKVHKIARFFRTTPPEKRNSPVVYIRPQQLSLQA